MLRDTVEGPLADADPVARVERGASTAEANVPLSIAPGEAYQFDWSHE